MPIYEFQCQACGTEIEVLQKISDPHLTDCEACGKSEMKKKVTAAAFRLSGAGWYETDFKKDSDKKKNLSETASDSKDQKPGDAKKESKDSSSNDSGKSSDKNSTKTETTAKEPSKPKKDKTPSKD